MNDYSFSEGLNHLGLALNPEPFLAYIDLLAKWNAVHNLTAIKSKDAMILKHLLDSLAIFPWIKGPKVLDVGTGAGLPGIPLALAFPDLELTLVESNGKKVGFLEEAKRQLAISNLSIKQTRIENFKPNLSFDTVVSRAFSELRPMINSTKHLLLQNGIWLAMKGKYPEKELTTIDKTFTVETYKVPGLDEERCCVIIKNS